MRNVAVASDETATVSGGARAADVVAATEPLGLAPVTGSVAAVGMAGLTLGGGYGPLIGRFGLALDNLEAAEVVLADGRAVVADHQNEEELFWALRGGGGNFGVVTAMRLELHRLPSVRSGMLIYPFAEAKAVVEGCAEIGRSAGEELTSQVGFAGGPDGAPMIMVVPTWCGPPAMGLSTLRRAPRSDRLEIVQSISASWPLKTMRAPLESAVARFISALLLQVIHLFDLPAIRAQCVSRGRRA
jgi:FAD/FMN-containing dehydrogenase